MDNLNVERYRLVLTHDLIVDGRVIRADERKTCQTIMCDTDRKVAGYTNHILDELFYRFRKELQEDLNHDHTENEEVL